MAQGLYYNPLLPVYLFPPSENFERLKTYEIYDSGRNFATMYWPYSNTGLDALSQNPYWITNRNMFNTKQNRYIVSGSLKWKITDWINLSGRIRMDHADTDYERKLYASTPGLFCQSKGHYREQKMTNNALYADVLLNIDKQAQRRFPPDGQHRRQPLRRKIRHDGTERQPAASCQLLPRQQHQHVGPDDRNDP